MEVQTHNMRVLNARKTVLELILSDHPFECLVCAKSGHCDLQNMAIKMGVREIPYKGEQSTYKEDTSPAILRDVDKCIMCRRCETMCNDVQTVGVLSAINRGFESVVAPAFERNLDHSECTYCGQCVAVCPTAALTEVDHTNQVIRLLADPTKTVIVQTAPAVRAALGEEFGMEAGTLVTGKMVLHCAVLDSTMCLIPILPPTSPSWKKAQNCWIVSRKYLNGDKEVKLPMLTSCCPGWVNFLNTISPI
jgi:NADP-reducing hydrogenase subunit HndD